METYTYKGYQITIDYDQFATNPADDGNFSVVTFNTDTITDAKISDYFTGAPSVANLLPQYKAAWKAGTMFGLQYSSHGPQVAYRALDDVTTDLQGFIVLDDEYAKNGATRKDRFEIAQQDLAEYDQWANGEVYYVSFINRYGEVPDDGDVAGIGDIIGYDNARMFAEQAVDADIAWDMPNRHVKYARELHR